MIRTNPVFVLPTLQIKDSAISPTHMIDQIVIAWTEGNLSVLDFKSTTVARRSPLQVSENPVHPGAPASRQSESDRFELHLY